ncbi:MAG: aldehyde dehydrogenase family protein [Acidimicrobiales bacterium]
MTTRRYRLAVPGAEASGDLLEVYSPYSGEVLAEVEQAGPEAADRAVALQRQLLAEAGPLPPHQRIEVLRRAAGIMRARRLDLTRQIVVEGGKPIADAAVEVERAVNGVELCAAQVGALAGEEVPMGLTAASTGRLAFTTREPIGVVAAISAFNHPLNLVVHQAGPAIAAGCPVIVKPAATTPLSCLAFVDILAQAGLPQGWCVALPCPNEVAERLATSAGIAFLSFIGSPAVGWSLRSKLAPGVRCALEHGGAAPLIVDQSADLDRAVPLILKGGYYHAGQVCVSVQRVFAHRSVKAELVDRLVAGLGALRTGDPMLPGTEVGPLITASAHERVSRWVTEAADAGARVAAGGHPLDHQCYEPTLLVDTPADARAFRDEVFGPVVNIVGVDTLAEAVARANAVPWAFQAAIVTRDIDRALWAARHLDATAVMVNDHTAFRVDWMPFGGRGASGLGVGGIPGTTADMTRPKLVVFNMGDAGAADR